MSRRVEFEGRIIDVPDDATDDEVAEIISGSAGTAANAAGAPGEVPADTFDIRGTARQRGRSLRATPDPVNSTAGSFFGGVGEQLGLTPDALLTNLKRYSGYDAYTAIRDGRLADVPPAIGRFVAGPMLGAGMDTTQEAVQAPARAGARAGEAFGEGRNLEGAGHAAAAMVPVLGGQLSDIGEEFGTDPVRAAGRTTALITPMLVGGLKGEAPEFDPSKVRQTVYERTGKFGRIEKLTERSIIGSKAFREFRIAALDDMSRIANETADRISKFKAGDDPLLSEQLGNEVKVSLTKMRANVAKHTAALENEINKVATPKRKYMLVRDPETREIIAPSPGKEGLEFVNKRFPNDKGSVADPATGAWVDISAWDRPIAELRKITNDPHAFQGRFKPRELAEIQSTLAELKSNPRMIPWDTAQLLADKIRKFVRDDADVAPSTMGRTSTKLNRTLDAAMEDALTRTGGPELAAKWRDLQALKDDSRQVYLQGIADRLQKTKPEAVHRFIMDDGVSLDDARVLVQRLPKDQRQAIAAANLREALQKSTTQIREGGQLRNILDAHKLAHELDQRMVDGKLGMLLNDKALTGQLQQIVREARAMKQPPEIDVNSLDPGNQQLNIGKAFRGEVGASTLGTVTTLFGATKWLLSPNPWRTILNGIGNVGLGTAARAVAAGSTVDDRRRQQEAAAAATRSRQQRATPTPSRGSIQ